MWGSDCRRNDGGSQHSHLGPLRRRSCPSTIGRPFSRLPQGDYLMTRMKLTCILLIALLFPIVAQAKTAAELREECAAFDYRPKSESDAAFSLVQMRACISYIDGVLDVPLM